MDIRVADSKGRLVAGEKGVVYSRSENDAGVVTLTPVRMPIPPSPASDVLAGVYVNPGMMGSTTIVSVVTEIAAGECVELLEDLAVRYGLPVVVNRTTRGAAISDMLDKQRVSVVEVPWDIELRKKAK